MSRDNISVVAKRSLREDKRQEVPKIVVVEVIIIIIIIIIMKEEKLKRETESPIIASNKNKLRNSNDRQVTG